VLTWSDEFDATDGTPPDPNTWTPEIGGDGWGNQEREYYTGELANAVQQGGSLVITATPDGASGRSCWYGACRYTSARLITQGHFSQRYGKFEARIQIPAGQGIWPAFWLLGDNIDDVGWPACGEIDVMENIGSTPATVYGSVHGTGVSHTASYDLAAGAFADDFHVYGIEWEPQTVRFYVDGDLYDTRTQQGSGGTWPFDDGPEFLLLNVAVGGSWPGDPDASTVFPQQMKVDWVRVYASP
jgi:beta-glucanase (GH16 family)